MEHIKSVINNEIKKKENPIKTGFKFLDETLEGYYPREMTAICGCQNSGKTAFVITQLNNIAVDQHIPTLFVINSMTERNFLSSMIACYCSIKTKNIHSVLDSDSHRDTVKEYLEKLGDAPLYVEKADWFEDEDYFESLEKVIIEKDIKIVFFDEVIHTQSLNESFFVSQTKILAMKLNIPVVTTCCISHDEFGVDALTFPGLSKYVEIHGHDVAINLVNYEHNNVYQDEEGRDLHNMIGIIILKHKGSTEKKKCLLPLESMYIKNYTCGKTHI